MQQAAVSEIAITGGRVIDPATGVDRIADVLVSGGTVTQIGERIEPPATARIIDARGLLVVPGLIDIHAHVYTHMGASVDPDLIGVRAGVTTVVDAGTAGPYTWNPFQHQVIERATTRMFAFLHISRTGQAFIPEIRSEDDIDIDATIKTAREHAEHIVGIKLRAVGPGVANIGSRMVDLTKQAARASGGLQMIHIGDMDSSADDPQLTRDVVNSLDAGDILAHIYTDQPGNVLDATHGIMPEVLEARARGVIMEASPGRANFSFDAARRLLDHGLLPDVIGSDLTEPGRGWLVYSLTEVMSRFLALGFAIPDVIRMTTSAPARVLKQDTTLGSLAVGRVADITLLRAEQGRWIYRDLRDGVQRGETALAPVLTIRAGEPVTPDWGPHPWGWLPESDPAAS